ncbi:uncharacterized protein LOC121827954 isoform X1 [Peromyscus maniculatus bairdii]|uniref:uncharacterized protein LOC121827954 isoform X1 n=1 Tax=Peromyscus maniculatus bairdii TaxID=230844 RepID=UPI003FD32400
MIKISVFLVNRNTAWKLRPPRTRPRAAPIRAAETGSSWGRPGHRACDSSRSASGRSPRSGAADGGRAGSGASGPLLTATPAARDGGAPGRGLWHLLSRHSPGPSRTSRGARHGPGHAALRSPAPRLASRHARPGLRG